MKKGIIVCTCDRCGANIEKESSVKNITFSSNDLFMTADGKNQKKGVIFMDLCQDCADSFKIWWDGTKKAPDDVFDEPIAPVPHDGE